jgi:hypothetical protein
VTAWPIATASSASSGDRLEHLLAIPYYLSPAWLGIDPTFHALRGAPRFARLTSLS